MPQPTISLLPSLLLAHAVRPLCLTKAVFPSPPFSPPSSSTLCLTAVPPPFYPHPPQARAKGLPLRVTLVSPGAVDTPFQLGRNFGGSPKVEPLAEAGPQLAVEDVVRTVVWCLAVPPHMEVNDVMVRAVPLEQQ